MGTYVDSWRRWPKVVTTVSSWNFAISLSTETKKSWQNTIFSTWLCAQLNVSISQRATESLLPLCVSRLKLLEFLHPIHQMSVSKVWRVSSYPYSSTDFVWNHKELHRFVESCLPIYLQVNQPFTRVQRRVSLSKLLQFLGIWVEVITSRTQHSSTCSSCLLSFSLSPSLSLSVHILHLLPPEFPYFLPKYFPLVSTQSIFLLQKPQHQQLIEALEAPVHHLHELKAFSSLGKALRHSQRTSNSCC